MNDYETEGMIRYPPPANAKRVGWNSYFEGKTVEQNPFPLNRPDLKKDYKEGWLAASQHKMKANLY